MNYEIVAGGRPNEKRCRKFELHYGSVKNITLRLEKHKLAIECSMRKKKTADQFFGDRNNCFSEALKKGMLFHLLLYSTPLSTENIRIYINGKESEGYVIQNSPIVYSLIDKNLQPALPAQWQNAEAVFQYFRSHPKSKQGDLAASLYSLLYAKTKRYETERFIYLWMSMNGLYNHLAKIKDQDIRRENKKIQILEEAQGWGCAIADRDCQMDLSRRINGLSWKYGFGTKEFYQVLSQQLAEFPSKERPYDIQLDGYLNLWYPYFLRCSLFHAERPLALFSLENEFEIKCLRFVNGRLENFLEHNLPDYFDESYCRKRLSLLPENA